MILSDTDILLGVETGRIGVEPFEASHVQPASLDLRIGSHFKVFQRPNPSSPRVLDPWVDDLSQLMVEMTLRPDESFTLHPGDFALATTMEYVKLPHDIVGRVDGRSSIGRFGLIVHSTAGFIDPGFEGQITLELANLNAWPVRLHPGKRVCQISFHAMTTPAAHPYGPARGSKYQGQTGATASRIVRDA